ncbi:MAG TPA: LysM peptidoglycan-binding domain-containing protein [Candidatus Omnitrophota bacterium]|nr:LysM peptidoglycan-binding domain-containing protein [Candidatus Omnitrophota bacterium]HOX09279.1 LysM peptidoglycan-binding domain-containing protein [Candidatus Omnitrophota bacterium]HPN66961.1 LysM peptidoglycan-binding domain-containing protein [Candidatus Omnitrophota bacterium]HRZ66850.1 LysM peptidoglycan-binding domain-containing protein [Candidatus Omnitrophota bacterium]
MKKFVVLFVLAAASAAMVISLAGCSVNTKMVTRERVDQDLSISSGNRGYLMGTAPAEGDRKTTREYIEVQVEVPSIEKESDVTKKTAKTSIPATNYETSNYEKSYVPETVVEEIDVVAEEEFVNYKVQKNDTLQKISMKYFGTTKKWKKIFDANTDTLRSPDKLKPGMTIRIPKEGATDITINEYIK